MAVRDIITEFNHLLHTGRISAYAIGGAVAALRYIEASSTEDVDVFIIIDAPPHPLNPIADVWSELLQRGAKQIGEYLRIGDWPVQLLMDGSPLVLKAIETALIQDFDGLEGKVMRPEFLAALALQTGRSKDYQRISDFLKQQKVSISELLELIDVYQLQGRWADYLKRYPLEHA